MTPAALVAELQARGVVLRPDGSTLRVRPVSKVTTEELDTLRLHKVEVLKLLLAPPWPPTYAHPWPDALPDLGRRTVGPFSACAECPTWTWVRFGTVPLCLACALRRGR